MSSDPKGPETTPLTAANAARAMTLLVMASRVDSNLRSAVADVESYIAELQREIEGLRAVSEQQQQRAQLAEGKLEGYRQALESIRDNRNAQPGVPCSGSCVDKAERVLAGKEAQG